ncbi:MULTISPECIES: helix-turn-helix domain-containing protein [Pectobacterium]|uniref:helix-turn-helix domain-containing protein n=1 Tax=Pectobacterium TaxID=122277 RepID=UPI0011984C7C|nr:MULTISPECIES: helix-turn-helix domain-containing protein [Pectobacterium]MDY4388695.1 helix-turn-helix domain-containing protein [Pectobacterium aroidearum]QDX97072.1 helix-turn-helix domain-containing protein [Pectobacterium carotovorum subsp. carotovorum]
MKFAEKIVDDLIKWIEDNVNRPLYISDVAEQAGYSKWHLQRIFHQYTGENLASYIRKRKLSLAARDLNRTNERVIDISQKYGFDSQQSFTRSFSKAFNVSPIAYRKQNNLLNP